MTQEEKQLLLKDLCPRLPYGVKVELHDEVCTLLGYFDDFVVLTSNTPMGQQTNIANIKPYLRPMSSMTEEEVKEIRKINWQFCKPNNVLFECFVGNADDGYCSISQMAGILDYLNAHHFDYRIDQSTGKTLIESGLALEAPEGMYKTE